MEKNFLSVEEVLIDESFLSWYFHKSPGKVQEWNDWLAANPQQQPLFNEAVHIMSLLHVREKEVPVEAIESAYQRLDASLDELEKGQAPVHSIKRNRRWWWMSAAAIFILFAGLATFKFMGNHKTTIAAQYGEINKQLLPDGTEVVLNANSTVTLGKNWADDADREVWLKGEAFFHVTKTSNHNRFIVHADKMDVIVTGTKFNVITRDGRSSVLLTEGSVTIRLKDGKEVIMKPGDFVEFNNDQLEMKPVNEEAILAWKDNNLYFDNTPMTEAAKIISEHYGIKVTLADQQVKERSLAGIMQNNNLDVLLKSLEAMDFRITRKEDEIIISTP